MILLFCYRNQYADSQMALTIILIRAGLGLDLVKLRQLSGAALRLSTIPNTSEATTVAIMSKFLLDVCY